MIIAKPVIKNRFWILRNENQKVGNIEATTDGYQVKINNNVAKFKTINMVKRQTGIDFMPAVTTGRNKLQNHVYGFPTTGPAHNAMYEVKLQLPLFTKTAKSKSWYAAGWYKINQNKSWQTVFCPKLITLRRYQYLGPFNDKDTADEY